MSGYLVGKFMQILDFVSFCQFMHVSCFRRAKGNREGHLGQDARFADTI